MNFSNRMNFSDLDQQDEAASRLDDLMARAPESNREQSAITRNPAYDGPMGIFDDFEGCDSGIGTTPKIFDVEDASRLDNNSITWAEEARIRRKKEQAAEDMYDALLNCRFFDTPVMRRRLGNDPFVLDILKSVREALTKAGHRF